MRLALALALVAFGAVPAAAQPAGDRYGYGPSPQATAARASQPLESQGIRALTWASKARAPVAQGPAAPQVQPMSMAMAAAPGRAWTRDLPPPPSAASRNSRPSAYQPFQPQAPYQAQQLAALTPPPAPLARQPVAAARAPAPPIPAPAAKPPRGPALAGGPPPAPAPQQVAQAAPPQVGTPVHFYSLHRGYGLTPDAIPEPPTGQRYVLMGPPDKASAPSADRDDDTDDDTQSGKRSRPF